MCVRGCEHMCIFEKKVKKGKENVNTLVETLQAGVPDDARKQTSRLIEEAIKQTQQK